MQSPGKRPYRRVVRALGLAAAGLLLCVVLAAGGFALWLAQADLKPIIEREASEGLGRKVSLGAFEVGLGNLLAGDPLQVELRDLRIANAPWGSDPDMVRLGQLSALIDVTSLLTGVLRYERLRLADLKVVLERDPSGAGNWKFGGSAGAGGFGLVPKNRTQFPTLIDFAGERALITYRTRSGNVLRIALDQVAIASPDESSAVSLQANGAYNDVAARLDATTESYTVLRNARVPFGARFRIVGDHTDLAFDGTMMEPLDFEGVRGKLSLTAKTLDDLLAVLGAPGQVNLPLLVFGDLARDGDHWALTAAKGRLLRAPFTGKLELLEGKAGAPDDVTVDLDFAPVDLDPILAALDEADGKSKKEIAFEVLPLHPAGLAALNLTAKLSTEQLAIAGRRFPSFALDGRLEGGDVALRELKFAFGGGTLAFDGSLQGKSGQGDLKLNAHLIKARAEEIASLLGGGDEIRGRLDGTAMLRMRGATLSEGLKNSSGAAIVTLAQGDIARSLVEQVSADLRSLFRSEAGRVKVGCLLAAMVVKDGIGTLSPLRLESDEAIVLGGGKVDLVGKRLDLTLQTERDSTSFFALDLPIRISGPFDQLSVAPDSEADQSWIKAAQQGAAPDGLPKALRDLAQKNACAE